MRIRLKVFMNDSANKADNHVYERIIVWDNSIVFPFESTFKTMKCLYGNQCVVSFSWYDKNEFIVVRTYYDFKLRCDVMVIESCSRRRKIVDKFCSPMNSLFGFNNESYSVECKNIVDYDWKK